MPLKAHAQLHTRLFQDLLPSIARIQEQFRKRSVPEDAHEIIHAPDPVCVQYFVHLHPEHTAFRGGCHFSGKPVRPEQENNVPRPVLIDPFLDPAHISRITESTTGSCSSTCPPGKMMPFPSGVIFSSTSTFVPLRIMHMLVRITRSVLSVLSAPRHPFCSSYACSALYSSSCERTPRRRSEGSSPRSSAS